MADEPRRLSPKQQAFVLAYIGEAKFNATKAAIMAGYSEKSAADNGHNIRQNPIVAARIQEHLDSLAAPAGAILVELADVAMSEWRDFLQIKRDKDGEIIDARMDLSSKVKALEVLAKAHGLLTDRVDISGTLTSTVELVGIDAGDI